MSNARSASGVAGEIGDREARVRGAQIGDQNDAGAAVEGQHGRRAAAGGGAPAGLVDQLVCEQRFDTLCDGRARQPGAAREVRARDRLAVANQRQNAARARRRGGVGPSPAVSMSAS